MRSTCIRCQRRRLPANAGGRSGFIKFDLLWHAVADPHCPGKIDLAACLTGRDAGPESRFSALATLQSSPSLSTSGVDGLALELVAKHLGGSFEQLNPSRSISGWDSVKLLGQLHQRAVALDRRDRHLRLQGQCMVPARSPAHALSFAGESCQAEAPVTALCRFPKSALGLTSQEFAASLLTNTRFLFFGQRALTGTLGLSRKCKPRSDG
jgi:hypothetical protein